MFFISNFNGDISKWNVSNVKNMSYMFSGKKAGRRSIYPVLFIGDISKWDVSNVEDMSGMFNLSEFNGDISKWDVSNVKNTDRIFGRTGLFAKSAFKGDISEWKLISNDANYDIKWKIERQIEEKKEKKLAKMQAMLEKQDLKKGKTCFKRLTTVFTEKFREMAKEAGEDISKKDLRKVQYEVIKMNKMIVKEHGQDLRKTSESSPICKNAVEKVNQVTGL
jgi:hypothetical protein